MVAESDGWEVGKLFNILLLISNTSGGLGAVHCKDFKNVQVCEAQGNWIG